MRIAEIYKSIQGEGLLTGTESVFVRTSGCNLRCWFCDTPFTSWRAEGEDLAVAEIAERVLAWPIEHVVLTGGEPMLFAELIPLCSELRLAGRHITIETAGTLYLPLECDLMSISPKLGNSPPDLQEFPKWHRRHEATRHAPDVVRRLIDDYRYQIKFVIDDPTDVDEVERYVAELHEVIVDRVLLMPQGIEADQLASKGAWLEPLCRQHGFRYCPRQQIEWFGAIRGT